ncbi:hypothetical protein OG978_29700 [Streptomyces sp. NBC_01591]|uniref:hypothetical protein n=1 Tax=Streptomyces sp. NBC_01591 TaxID=2975888 RepID=UPI002DD92675|nr:hypothetical protein [Streptomyces sp. NBC_01591]WSD71190.1 hypothetical protein OG978_29700 [Streptomyces sp. NBC_01591]
MIRIVTTARLRRLTAALYQARRRAAEVQKMTDQAFAGHTRSALDLSSRVERAEHVCSSLRAALEDAHSGLKTAVLLLHYGEPHSIHLSLQAAEDHAVELGADRACWGPGTGLPASQVAWRAMPFSLMTGPGVA